MEMKIVINDKKIDEEYERMSYTQTEIAGLGENFLKLVDKTATILEKGGTEDPMALYKAFRGREPSVEPLLRKRGLKLFSLKFCLNIRQRN